MSWIELLPERQPLSAPALQRALAMLLLPEEQLPGQDEAVALIPRLLQRRFGSLSADQRTGSRPFRSRRWRPWPWTCSTSRARRI